VEQLARDVFNVHKKERELEPIEKLRSCTREEILRHMRSHRVELYWQNCISREMDSPFWQTLRKHVDDTSLDPVPWSVADWPIEQPKTEVGFRYFRIKATGPNADPGNYRATCGGIELYGTLIEVSEGIPPPGDTNRFSTGAAMVGYKAVATGSED
jgi:hypothetical protein